jgi:hypothetical protein
LRGFIGNVLVLEGVLTLADEGAIFTSVAAREKAYRSSPEVNKIELIAVLGCPSMGRAEHSFISLFRLQVADSGRDSRRLA